MLKTISPETVTNENFHSMYFNLKMLVGRSQAKYFMGFLFSPKSSNLLFFNWKIRVLASTFCDCDNVKKVLLAERKLQALKSAKGLKSYLEHFFL